MNQQRDGAVDESMRRQRENDDLTTTLTQERIKAHDAAMQEQIRTNKIVALQQISFDTQLYTGTKQMLLCSKKRKAAENLRECCKMDK